MRIIWEQDVSLLNKTNKLQIMNIMNVTITNTTDILQIYYILSNIIVYLLNDEDRIPSNSLCIIWQALP